MVMIMCLVRDCCIGDFDGERAAFLDLLDDCTGLKVIRVGAAVITVRPGRVTPICVTTPWAIGPVLLTPSASRP